MISWMQRHNKYLVWTIWVATITFIGAGFMGWGSYNLSSGASSIAKVGTIEVSQNDLNQAYSSLYARYNEMMDGKMDEAQAQKMGLVQQAFETTLNQARLLNLAKEFEVVISDEVVAQHIATLEAFQENGTFNQKRYNQYLTMRGMKPQIFEENIREEMTYNKTLDMLKVGLFPFEKQVANYIFGLSERIDYKVLTDKDINITVDEKKLKAYWQLHKEMFMIPEHYTLSLLQTPYDKIVVTAPQIEEYYKQNSFNYANAEGKQLTLDEAKEQVIKELQIEGSKKEAQKAYIAFKKGETNATQRVEVVRDDLQFSQEVWKELNGKTSGEILKPKVINEHYTTIRIDAIKPSQIMSFEQAQLQVEQKVKAQEYQNALNNFAEESLKKFDTLDVNRSEYLSLNKPTILPPLSLQESVKLAQQLFTSLEEKGIISLTNTKLVLYKIVDQKNILFDTNETKMIEETFEQIKQQILFKNLLKVLDQHYQVENYKKGS